MRAVAIILALLAGAKVWTHQTIFRQATEEALITAYRERAIEACERSSARALRGPRQERPTFINPSRVELVIGNSNIAVNIWDVDNALWGMRFKYPYLMVTSAEGTPAGRCQYDVTLASAELQHL